MFMNKIVIGAVSAALLVSGPAQAVVQTTAQTTTDTAVATVNVAQGMQKITYSDDPFVAPEQGLTGRAFAMRWDAIQAEAQQSGVDGSLCDTDTRERTANVVVSIGATDDGVPREYYAVTNSTGQLVEVIARDIIVQNDDTETVSDKGRYCDYLPFVPGAGKGFDRGHVIADSLGGQSNVYNLAPQNATLNRHGDQAFIENQIRKAGGAADFHAVLTYPDSHSDVPSRYSIAYSLENTPRVRTFANIDPDSAGPEDAYEVVSPSDDMYEFVGDVDSPEVPVDSEPGVEDDETKDDSGDMNETSSSMPWIIAVGVVLAIVGFGSTTLKELWRNLTTK